MKSYFSSLLGVVGMSFVIGTAASCSDHQKGQPDPTIKTVEVTPAPAHNPVPERTLPPTPVSAVPVAAVAATPSVDPFADASSALDRVTRDQASTLTAVPEAVSRNIDSNLTAWKSRGGSSTTMAENKLELARTDFAQKIRTLTLADEQTWKNAKVDAQSSLENLRHTYEELLAGQDRA